MSDSKENFLNRLEEINVHIRQHQDALQNNQNSHTALTAQLHGWLGARDEINRILSELEKMESQEVPSEA